jgi:hypothetical protein
VSKEVHEFVEQHEMKLLNSSILCSASCRTKSSNEFERDKARVARAYNKKVESKSFQIGGLIWKTIQPLGAKSNKFGKWPLS